MHYEGTCSLHTGEMCASSLCSMDEIVGPSLGWIEATPQIKANPIGALIWGGRTGCVSGNMMACSLEIYRGCVGRRVDGRVKQTGDVSMLRTGYKEKWFRFSFSARRRCLRRFLACRLLAREGLAEHGVVDAGESLAAEGRAKKL